MVRRSGFGGFPKIRDDSLGVPIIQTIIFWGLYWGPPILGNSHLGFRVFGFGFSVYKAQGLGSKVPQPVLTSKKRR